jgi:hypothetical protein
VEIVKRYPGQRVTRRCPSCGQFFDVELPPKDTGSG